MTEPLPLTRPKGFDYQTVKTAIDAGARVLARIDRPERPMPPGPMVLSIEELHRAANFRPRHDPPPNT